MRELSAFDIAPFDFDGTLCEYRRPDDQVLQSAFESTGVGPSFTIVEYLDEYRHGDYVEQYGDVDVIRDRAFAAERDRGNVRSLLGALKV